MAFGIQGSMRPMTPQQPQYGLSGAYNILGYGNQPQPGGRSLTLNQTVQRNNPMASGGATGGIGGAIKYANQGIRRLQPWIKPGVQAHDAQAALSGAMGPEAQAAAYDGFMESPGQQWLREQGERALTRNAAALGGLGGGNVMKELTKYGQGLAAQDFQNYYGRMGDVANRGLQAQGLATGLDTTKSQAATAHGAQQAQMRSAAIGAAGSAAAANIAAEGAAQRDAARYAMDTGNQIAGNVNANTSALASLINQQGSGLGNLYGVNTGNLANLLVGGGNAMSGSLANQAGGLGNIRMGSSAQYAGLPMVQNMPNNTMSNFGNLLGGAGMFAGSPWGEALGGMFGGGA